MELSNLSDDAILVICEKLDTPSLESFLKTSKNNYNICLREWQLRHSSKYPEGHRFLSSRARQSIIDCLKGNVPYLIFEYLRPYMTITKIGSYIPAELKRLYNKMRDVWDDEYQAINLEHGDYDTSEEEELFIQMVEDAGSRIFNQMLDMIHNDISLIVLYIITQEVSTEFSNYIYCPKVDSIIH